MLTLPPDPFLILGHRGASAYVPENSAAAFRLAAEQGADGVELDVRRTADGVLVVHHDATVAGVAIVDLPFDEVRRRAPTLLSFAEAMEACAGMIVNVEIKNSPMDADFDPNDTVAAEVVRWVTRHGWSDRVIVSSFNKTTIDRVRELEAGLATGQLIDPGSDAVRQLEIAHARGHTALHPHISSVIEQPGIRAGAAELGLWLIAWTVDEPEMIRYCKGGGLTGVITNDPALAVVAAA